MNRRVWVAFFASTLLLGCSLETPIRIGFLGGLSDRGSDVGQAARNGAILAVEQWNQAKRTGRRSAELVVRDDEQNEVRAIAEVKSLIAAHVDAVIGPYTSSMAKVALPYVNEAKLLMLSPTVTSADFVGNDDFLFRLNRSTRDNAEDYAKILYERGQRHVAIAYDKGNASFTESWLSEFRKSFGAAGGEVVAAVPFESQTGTAFKNVVGQMLVSRPDGLLFLALPIDVARLAQQATKLAPKLPKSASEWAASETLIELGGNAVNGLLIAQAYNRFDQSESYRRFYDSYKTRFGVAPGYSSIAAYDSANVVLEAISRKRPEESIKDALRKYGPYKGLQQTISFDHFGDTRREVYFTEVQAGHFVQIK